MTDDQRRNTVFVAELEHDGYKIAQRVATFTPNKHLDYSNPRLDDLLNLLADGRAAISLTATSLARFVELSCGRRCCLFRQLLRRARRPSREVSCTLSAG